MHFLCLVGMTIILPLIQIWAERDGKRERLKWFWILYYEFINIPLNFLTIHKYLVFTFFNHIEGHKKVKTHFFFRLLLQTKQRIYKFFYFLLSFPSYIQTNQRKLFIFSFLSLSLPFLFSILFPSPSYNQTL